MGRHSSDEERRRGRDKEKSRDKDKDRDRRKRSRSRSRSSSAASDDRRRKRDKKERKKDRHERHRKEGGEKKAEELDLWVEKAPVATAQEPETAVAAQEPLESKPAQREDNWMSFASAEKDAGEDAGNSAAAAARDDPFASLFSASTSHRKSKAELLEEKRAAEAKLREPGRSERELNPYWKSGAGDGLPPLEERKRKYEFGDAGSNWRMIKLRKVREIAEEEGRSIEDVALERYGTLEDYEEALEERRWLDARSGGSGRGSGYNSGSSRPRMERNRMDDREMSGRAHLASKGESFRRPTEERERYGTPSARSDRSGTGTPNPEQNSRSTPQPEKPAPRPLPSVIPSVPSAASRPILTTDQLNKLQAKIIRARLMKDPSLPALEREYESEKRRTESGAVEETVVLPSIDSRGRLMDLPSSSSGTKSVGPLKRSKPWAAERAQGDREADPGKAPDLMELLRREKMGGDDDFDREFAERIAKDASFKTSLDYLDEQSDRMARQVNRSDDKKKQFAVNDYKKVQSALEKCGYCYQDDGKTAPKAPIVSLGTRVYLALPQTVEMVKGHCFIVPVQHVNNCLELDDDAWEEVRNFMKCLTQLYASYSPPCAPIFTESFINPKHHKHCVIECIPLPSDLASDAPAYFKDALLNADEEWSTHKKIIDTSNGGIRKNMVKNLPFFHVWFDPNRGYGHVIEDSGAWKEWFGREVLGGMLDLSPDVWRRAKWADRRDERGRLDKFRRDWERFDWTQALDEG